MKTLIATAAISIFMLSGTADAGMRGDKAKRYELNLNVLKQVQAQAQKQQQTANNEGVTVNQDFESRPSGPSLGIALAGLPSFSNSGVRNACGGLEADTFSIGGSVGLSGGQISGSGGLIGWGGSTIEEIEGCEKRESVAQLWEMGMREGAVAVACTHKHLAVGINAQFPGACGGTAPLPAPTGNDPEPEVSSNETTGSDFAWLD